TGTMHFRACGETRAMVVFSHATGGDLELLPDAKPYALDCSPVLRRRPAAGHRRSASALLATDQLPREMARVSLARAVRLFRDGRALFAGRCSLRGVEPRARRTRAQSRRLALDPLEGFLDHFRPRQPAAS